MCYDRDYASTVLTCIEPLGECPAKSLIRNLLILLCPPPTCDISHAAQCMDLFQLQISHYEVLYEEEADDPPEEDDETAVDPPTPCTKKSCPKKSKRESLKSLPSMPVSVQTGRNKQKTSNKHEKTPKTGSAKKKSKSKSPKKAKSAKKASKSKKRRRRREVRDVVDDALRGHVDLAHRRQRRSTQKSSSKSVSVDTLEAVQIVEYKPPKPKPPPEQPGFCWYGQRLIFTSYDLVLFYYFWQIYLINIHFKLNISAELSQLFV